MVGKVLVVEFDLFNFVVFVIKLFKLKFKIVEVDDGNDIDDFDVIYFFMVICD